MEEICTATEDQLSQGGFHIGRISSGIGVSGRMTVDQHPTFILDLATSSVDEGPISLWLRVIVDRTVIFLRSEVSLPAILSIEWAMERLGKEPN